MRYREWLPECFSAPIDPSGGKEQLEYGSLNGKSGGGCGGLDWVNRGEHRKAQLFYHQVVAKRPSYCLVLNARIDECPYLTPCRICTRSMR